jgi:hypothetical protein
MKQKVHLGVTQSGNPGFFTGNYLALNLTAEEYEKSKQDAQYAKQLAARLGFEFEDKTYEATNGPRG